jgi:uncharacterized protein YxjI
VRGGGISEPYCLEDRSGWTHHVNKLEIHRDRFFSCYGATWLARNNLYDLNYELKREKYARQKYKKSLYKLESAAAEIEGERRLEKIIVREDLKM